MGFPDNRTRLFVVHENDDWARARRMIREDDLIVVNCRGSNLYYRGVAPQRFVRVGRLELTRSELQKLGLA